MCIHAHKPLHAIGCRISHVWSSAVEAPKPTSTVDSTSSSTSSSSSSSTGKGSQGKGKGKGKGPADSRGTKRQRSEANPNCWHYTNFGTCKNGDDCPKVHDTGARQRHLEKELARLSSSKVVQQTGAYGGYDGDYGADGDADGDI